MAPGEGVSVGIPAEHLPEDTLYCITTMAYVADEILCADMYCKADEAKVAEVMANDSVESAAAASSVDSFQDVPAASPYRAAIDWAVKSGIAKGTTNTTFGPSNTCTNYHILTFLYRADGGPVTGGKEPARVTWWARTMGLDTSNLNAPCTRAADRHVPGPGQDGGRCRARHG